MTGKTVSKDLYDFLQKTGVINENQEQALIALDLHGPGTTREILHHITEIGMIPVADPNTLRPRLTELEQEGYVHVPRKRPCKKAQHNRKVGVYELTPRGQNKLEQIHSRYITKVEQ